MGGRGKDTSSEKITEGRVPSSVEFLEFCSDEVLEKLSKGLKISDKVSYWASFELRRRGK